MKTNRIFKSVSRIILPVIFLAFGQTVLAQTPVPVTTQMPDSSKMTYNQISKTAGLFVYPAKGQSQKQQKKDEYECYVWAIEQSGIDPLNTPKTQAAPVQSGPDGSAVKGAAKGAAAGAAIGAAAGGMGGIRKGRQAQGQQQQQAQAQAAATDAQMKETFQKAFSVCIEGKGYTIK